ncbi:uncharacterized protein LOC135377614 isoform X2 [Ornithodoros turicata]|uniref:Putative conserved plasma membrane protein n=2 Tax=Ornithodoros turicata TaxID=34597 RepID=A0A2R5LDH4_9ACAR
MATRHRSLPPLQREKRPVGRKATAAVPEWLDVIHFGQVTPARDDFKSMATEDKSAVPSCYESCDSTSLSGSDNTSEGEKYGPLKDSYPGRYSFRSNEDGGDNCRITRLCITRHGSFGSTGFEPVAADTNSDDLPEIFDASHSRSSSSSENQNGTPIGRAALYASLPKDFLRVPRSRKGRFLLSHSKTDDRKPSDVAEVRRVPSDSADSGIYTTFGSEVRSYGIQEHSAANNQEQKQQQIQDGNVPCTVKSTCKSEEEVTVPSNPKSCSTAPHLEAEQRRRQRHTELASMLIFVPVVIAWVLIVPMVLFAYSIENPYSQQFQVALWIAIPASTSILVLSCLVSNVYWYYDEEQKRWRCLLHFGNGPRGFYWGNALTHSDKTGNVQTV